MVPLPIAILMTPCSTKNAASSVNRELVVGPADTIDQPFFSWEITGPQ